MTCETALPKTDAHSYVNSPLNPLTTPQGKPAAECGPNKADDPALNRLLQLADGEELQDTFFHLVYHSSSLFALCVPSLSSQLFKLIRKTLKNAKKCFFGIITDVTTNHYS